MSATRYVQLSAYRSTPNTTCYLVWMLVVFANFIYSAGSTLYQQHSQHQHSFNSNPYPISLTTADAGQQVKLSNLQIVQNLIKALHDLSPLDKSQEELDHIRQNEYDFRGQQSDQEGLSGWAAESMKLARNKQASYTTGGPANIGSESVVNDLVSETIDEHGKASCLTNPGQCTVDPLAVAKAECYQKVGKLSLQAGELVCDALLDQTHSIGSTSAYRDSESERSKPAPLLNSIDEILPDLTYLSDSNQLETDRAQKKLASDDGLERAPNYSGSNEELNQDRTSMPDCGQQDCPPDTDNWPREIERRLAPKTTNDRHQISYRGIQLTNSDSLMRGLLERLQRQRIPIVLVRLGELRNQRRSIAGEKVGLRYLGASERIHHRSDANLTGSPLSIDLSGLSGPASVDALATAANRSLTALGLMLGSNQGTMGMMSNQLVSKQKHSRLVSQVNQQSDPSTVNEASSPSSTVDSDSPLECRMRRFTYRAVKRDAEGNRCFGLVTATICYGGCETGEYAVWLFPHRKSFHRVCTHGGRLRRRTLLTECQTLSGSPLAMDQVDVSLRQYTYVDATHCVCDRCRSTDTACVGSLSQPYLPSLASEPIDSPQSSGQTDEQQSQAATYPPLVY